MFDAKNVSHVLDVRAWCLNQNIMFQDYMLSLLLEGRFKGGLKGTFIGLNLKGLEGG